MDVLIKGMEIPTDCCHCRMLEGDAMDGFCHAAERWLDDEYFDWFAYEEGDIDDSKPLNCPLLEVPTPHGRLIDAGALDKAAQKEWDDNEITNSEWVRIRELLKDAPTVIEAEG